MSCRFLRSGPQCACPPLFVLWGMLALSREFLRFVFMTGNAHHKSLISAYISAGNWLVGWKTTLSRSHTDLQGHKHTCVPKAKAEIHIQTHAHTHRHTTDRLQRDCNQESGPWPLHTRQGKHRSVSDPLTKNRDSSLALSLSLSVRLQGRSLLISTAYIRFCLESAHHCG